MTNWPDGYARRILDQVDSTLDEAHRVATDIQEPTWILARRQTKGRGRRGRAWVDPAGNFACALVFRPRVPLEQIALYSFVSSLALYDAFAACSVDDERLSLKWPNDLLLNDAKLAGILLESTTTGREENYLSIGIGANLINSPTVDAISTNALPPISLLQAVGLHLDPLSLLEELAAAFACYDNQLVSLGFASIRELWLSRAARIGTEIVARTIRHETRGVFETIDDRGSLILDTEQGRESIVAADIFF